MFVARNWFNVTSILSIVPLPTITCSFLSSISNLSPFFKYALSIKVFNLNVEPEISTSNLDAVL